MLQNRSRLIQQRKVLRRFLVECQNQGFWLKNFSCLHGRVRSQLKECLDSGFVPSWLTKGRTALLQKDKSKGNIASNYRPITCLS